MTKKKEYKLIKDLRELYKDKMPKEEYEEMISEAKRHKFLVGSIRNKSLHKVIFLAANIHLTKTELRLKLQERCAKKGQTATLNLMIDELSIKDIQEILGCNRRTAKDYHMFFKALNWILL